MKLEGVKHWYLSEITQKGYCRHFKLEMQKHLGAQEKLIMKTVSLSPSLYTVVTGDRNLGHCACIFHGHPIIATPPDNRLLH